MGRIISLGAHVPFMRSMMLALIAFASSAHAETRVALVIGNSNYQHATRLANPVNDADAISQVLAEAHFAVVREHNLGYEALRNALKQFSSTASDSDVALVYFAGHGLEMDGENYLVPTDAVLAHDGDVKYETVPLDLVRDTVAGARTLRLVFVDACRDNPFLDHMAFAAGSHRSIAERGLARIDETRPGEVVFFAAKERTTAADGAGGHSPFAAALIRDIPQPIELNLLIRTVSDDVADATNNTQLPYAYQSLTKQQFYFVLPAGGAIPAEVAPVVNARPIDTKTVELEVWKSVENSNDATQLQSYLDQYPRGSFVGVARAKIAALNKPAQTVATLEGRAPTLQLYSCGTMPNPPIVPTTGEIFEKSPSDALRVKHAAFEDIKTWQANLNIYRGCLNSTEANATREKQSQIAGAAPNRNNISKLESEIDSAASDYARLC